MQAAAALTPDHDAIAPITLDRQMPAADQIYTHLREAIVICRLRPNAPVSENRLCGVFGVSRSPVRTALTRLAEEGLIEIFPQRGSFVAPIKLTKVREGQFVRVSLEIAVLQRCSQTWSPQDARRAKAAIGSQRRYAKSGDFRAFHHADEAFHRVFADSADLGGVWTSIQAAKTQLDRVRHLANPVRGHMDKVIGEHLAVIEALDAGKVTTAIDIMRTHINSVAATIVRLRPLYADYFVEN